MLLDPFEEQFDLPAAAIELGDGEAGRAKLLVRKTSVLSVSGSLNRMRRSGASKPLREWKPVRTMVWSQISPVVRSTGCE